MMRRWGQVTRQPELASVSSDAELLALRGEVDAIHVSDAIQDYVLDLVRATRGLAVNATGANGNASPATAVEASAASRPMFAYGASPRASLGLYQAGKALAWLRGLDHVTPAIIQDVFLDVMRHRVGLTYEAEAEGLSADAILRQVLDRTRVAGSAVS
jgi:MoxR-like ATPase